MSTRFCPTCGRPVEATPQMTASSLATQEPVARVVAAAVRIPRKLTVLGGLAAGLTLLVVMVAVIGLLAASGPDDAVSAHMAALSKGDHAAAYALTSAGFRAQTSTTHFAALVAANPILRSGTLNIGAREVSGDAATVTAELTAADGTKRTLDFQLVKEGGDWRIAAYELRAADPSTLTARTSAARATVAPEAGATAPLVSDRVPCSSTAAQAPDPAPVAAVAPRLRLRLQAGAGLPAATFAGAPPSGLPDSGTRTFSIAALAASTGETVNFMADAPSPADFPASNFALEICDASNMTSRPEGAVRSLKGFPIQRLLGSTLSGNVTSLARWTVPNVAGTYRVDAYVWLEKTNTWHLVGRMLVTLTA